jgi:hypothetical protein
MEGGAVPGVLMPPPACLLSPPLCSEINASRRLKEAAAEKAEAEKIISVKAAVRPHTAIARGRRGEGEDLTIDEGLGGRGGKVTIDMDWRGGKQGKTE